MSNTEGMGEGGMDRAGRGKGRKERIEKEVNRTAINERMESTFCFSDNFPK